MGFLKKHVLATPWHLLRFFIPLVCLVPMAVYFLTVFPCVYPGVSAFMTSAAANLCQPNDLGHPLFTFAIRRVAALHYATLPLRLNLFCAACGAVAVSLFYVIVARLVFIFACEDPGGAMAALPPRLNDAGDDSRTKESSSFALNHDGSISIPHPEKCGYIEKLTRYGTVLSEVGSKDAAQRANEKARRKRSE